MRLCGTRRASTHEPRESPSAGRPRRRQRRGAVVGHGHVVRREAQPDEIPAAGLGDRQDRDVPVHPGEEPGLDPPADPAARPGVDEPPLLAVQVVHEGHHAGAPDRGVRNGSPFTTSTTTRRRDAGGAGRQPTCIDGEPPTQIRRIRTLSTTSRGAEPGCRGQTMSRHDRAGPAGRHRLDVDLGAATVRMRRSRQDRKRTRILTRGRPVGRPAPAPRTGGEAVRGRSAIVTPSSRGRLVSTRRPARRAASPGSSSELGDGRYPTKPPGVEVTST